MEHTVLGDQKVFREKIMVEANLKCRLSCPSQEHFDLMGLK